MSIVSVALAAATGVSMAVAAILACVLAQSHHRLAEARWDASHDHLTGLANRRSLMDALERARDEIERFSVGFVDLNNFKSLNDAFGHAVGDVVLQAVAGRLRRLDESVEMVSRLAGDEFVFLIRGDEDHCVAVANLAWTAIADRPVIVHGLAVSVSGSIGVAANAPGITGAELLHRADLALYRAKPKGGVSSWPSNISTLRTVRRSVRDRDSRALSHRWATQATRFDRRIAS